MFGMVTKNHFNKMIVIDGCRGCLIHQEIAYYDDKPLCYRCLAGSLWLELSYKFEEKTFEGWISKTYLHNLRKEIASLMSDRVKVYSIDMNNYRVVIE